MQVDSEDVDEDGKPIPIDISVAELIIHELQHDNIILENVLYHTVLNEFIQQIEINNVPDYNYFTNHENTAVCSLTVDLISSPYTLSDWEKHSIFITKEEDIIKQSLNNAVYALKSRRLEMMINDIQKQLKENPTEEEMMILMQTQFQLLQAKKEFNKLLGRIIVK